MVDGGRWTVDGGRLTYSQIVNRLPSTVYRQLSTVYNSNLKSTSVGGRHFSPLQVIKVR